MITQDEKANRTYYGKKLTAEEILFEKKAEPTPLGKELIKALELYSN